MVVELADVYEFRSLLLNGFVEEKGRYALFYCTNNYIAGNCTSNSNNNDTV